VLVALQQEKWSSCSILNFVISLLDPLGCRPVRHPLCTPLALREMLLRALHSSSIVTNMLIKGCQDFLQKISVLLRWELAAIPSLQSSARGMRKNVHTQRSRITRHLENDVLSRKSDHVSCDQRINEKVSAKTFHLNWWHPATNQARNHGSSAPRISSVPSQIS